MRVVNLIRYMLGYRIEGYKWAKKNGLVCEKDVSVMGGVKFGSEPYLITLKRGCRIAGDVTFITHDGGTWAFRHQPEFQHVVKYGRIEVGEHTFIGSHSIIMPGCIIGKNCVVGAGSVVTHSIPDNTVVAGVPARKICTTGQYAHKSKDAMFDDFDYERYNSNKKEYLIERYGK